MRVLTFLENTQEKVLLSVCRILDLTSLILHFQQMNPWLEKFLRRVDGRASGEGQHCVVVGSWTHAYHA